jgi:hypothetical protein
MLVTDTSDFAIPWAVLPAVNLVVAVLSESKQRDYSPE